MESSCFSLDCSCTSCGENRNNCCCDKGVNSNNNSLFRGCCVSQDQDTGLMASYSQNVGQENGESVQEVDRSRAEEIDVKTERKWVAMTAYQPVDTKIRTVEIPVVTTVRKYVPKPVYEQRIMEVPKYIPEYVEKFIDVPEIHYRDKIIEEPEYMKKYKYVPKIEYKTNIIERPRIEKKIIEKIVYEPKIKELIRYKSIDAVEEIIRYVPKGYELPEEFENKSADNVNFVGSPQTTVGSPYSHSGEFRAYYPQPPDIPLPDSVKNCKVEQVFRPKLCETVELQKQIPVNVQVPVPYMVPKPVIVPVEVPVLKFRDHFVPVPVSRRIIPRIRWTNEVYEVVCTKQKPYLNIQDVIKPVPADIEIDVHEYLEKIIPVNPAELSQADIHAMWMRVNADLAEKKKEEYGDKYPQYKYDKNDHDKDGFNHEEGNIDQSLENEGDSSARESATLHGSDLGENENPEGVKDKEEIHDQGGRYYESNNVEQGIGVTEGFTGDANQYHNEMMATLHPGHPLAMAYLQNRWIKTDTTSTHKMYTPEWFDAHHNALYNITMQNPTQVQMTESQARMFLGADGANGETKQPFSETYWMPKPAHDQSHMDQDNLHKYYYQPGDFEGKKCFNCGSNKSAGETCCCFTGCGTSGKVEPEIDPSCFGCSR